MAGPSLQAQVLPTAPTVVGGAAAVSQSGSQQTVTQTTDRAIINWGSFSIGAGAGVTFVQPGSSSVVLNRVTGNDPSSILGSMSANGQVFLVNPNGVFFGAGSRVDTGALVATTMSIGDDDFMGGRYNFMRSGGGAVENAGLITIREGGFALLAADRVSNTATGEIRAPGGSVQLASADRVTIDTRPDGLVGFSVSGESVRQVASVHNAGLISADGGQIALSARGARELTGMVVNNTGVLRASSIEERDGVVILSGSSGVTQSSGVLDTSGVRGGQIEVTNDSGVAAVSGSAAARGSAGAGGRIVVAGVQTGLMAGADVDASGTTGGSVRVGGEFRGGEVQAASGNGIVSDYTYVAQSAAIQADGTAGQGGSVVVWANESTRYDGTISARGAGNARGGDAEISGKEFLALNGTADLRSDTGAAGTLLIDPKTLTILDVDGDDPPVAPSLDGTLPASILAATAPGADSTISRGKLESLNGNANIVLEATDRITLNNMASGTLSLNTGTGNQLELRTTGANGVSRIEFQNASNTISTDGGGIIVEALGANGVVNIGNLTSNNGAIAVTSGGSVTTGTLNSGEGSVTMTSGSFMQAGNIDTNDGNVQLNATGALQVADISTSSGSIALNAGGAITSLSGANLNSGGGAVNVTATGTGTISLSTATINSGEGNVTLTTGTGVLQAANITTDDGNVVMNSAGNITARNIATSSGNISLTSTGASGVVSTFGGASINSGGGTINFTANGADARVTTGVNADIRSEGGNINLTAAGANGDVVNQPGWLRAGSGNVNLQAGRNIQTGNVDTTGTVAFNAGGAVSQGGSSSRLIAGAVRVDNAASVTLQSVDNEVSRFSMLGYTGSLLGFNSKTDLEITGVTASRAGGTEVILTSGGKLNVTSAVTATSSAGQARVFLRGGNGVDLNANVTATGVGGAAAKAAEVQVVASGGSVNQISGQLLATDATVGRAATNQQAHYAQVLVEASDGAATLRNARAVSEDGRAAITVNAKGNINVEGNLSVRSASQPGIRLNAHHNSGSGSVDTRNGTLAVEQTAELRVETPGPTAGTTIVTYRDINEAAPGAGGISLAGQNLYLGALSSNGSAEMRAVRAEATALYGIVTNSVKNTEFNQLATTDSLAGISLATSGDGTIKTQGAGLLQAPALALAGDPEVSGRGVFSLLTDTKSLQVLGGRGVDIDNTGGAKYANDTLVISALGVVSEPTVVQGENIPGTNLPIGGVRIKSKAISLGTIDNRTQNTYRFDGSTSDQRQDMVFYADSLEFLPSAIKSRDNTYLHLRPLTANKAISVVYDGAGVAGSLAYTAGPLVGLLGQFNPTSTVYIGNSDVDTTYTGTINIGTAGDTFARQISLGSMNLHFETGGVVNINYPEQLAFAATGSAPVNATINCVPNVLCIAAMTKDGKIYVRDSRTYVQDGPTRYVVVNGRGTGAGGITPENNGGIPSGGSSGGNGGNGNDSGPGGVNAPPSGEPGGGNQQGDPGSGVTETTTNPGVDNGNPGPGENGDPTDPGDVNGDGLGDVGGGPDGGGGTTPDPISGGGEWSDVDPGTVPDDQGPVFTGDPTPGDPPPGGDPTPTDPADPPGGGGTPTPPGDGGGGEFTGDPTVPTDPGTPPGDGGGTQTGGDPTPTPGGGGTPGDGGDGGGVFTGNDPGTDPGTTPGNPDGGGGTQTGDGGGTPGGQTPGDGTTVGGGTQDGTPGGGGSTTGGGDDVAGGGGTGNGGTGSGGTGNDGTGNDGGGTTVGGGSTTGGGTPGSGGGSGNGDGEFAGGGNGGPGGPGGNTGGGGSGGDGGGTFSDGSDVTPGGGTQVADGGGSGGSGNAGTPGGSSGNSGGSSNDGSGSGSGSGGSSGSGGTGSQSGGDGSSGGSGSGSGSGGFAGGGSGDSGGSGAGQGGADGGSVFSDGSQGGSDGTQVAGGSGQGGSGAGGSGSSGSGSGSSSGSGSGNSAGSGSAGGSGSGGSGSGSGSSGSGDGTESASSGSGSGSGSTGSSGSGDGKSQQSASQASGSGAGGAEDEFQGAASGGAESQGSTPGSTQTATRAGNTEQQLNLPPCDDEDDKLRAVSRPGQPNYGLVNTRGNGVRTRPESGTLQQQRAECARTVSQR